MAMDRTPLKDAEEAWIAKYRSALKNIPVQQSRSMKFHEAMDRVHSIIMLCVARILAGWLDRSRWKRSVQSAKPAPASQPQATRNRSLAESNAKVA